ncbi:hypothetical protein V5799_020042 [Amblyomma americanum]|uniref:Uncharacterized protein n=1 Tax=Amblyomma americanum TaxID=6943 RepID=A0AAQ4EUY5_AMBAM
MPAFYVLLGAIVVGHYTVVEFSTTIVDYGEDKGMTLSAAKHLITFSSVGQLAGRIVVPLRVPGTRRPLYVLLAKYLGVERTAASSGIVGVVMVPVSLLSLMIVGIFRDNGGSYDRYYRMLGALSLAAAALFIRMSCAAEKTQVQRGDSKKKPYPGLTTDEGLLDTESMVHLVNF